MSKATESSTTDKSKSRPRSWRYACQKCGNVVELLVKPARDPWCGRCNRRCQLVNDKLEQGELWGEKPARKKETA
jgi:hypothetical protein